ncbi:Glu/Leu/Phe/Val dehydrogenase [Zobellia galactanivorans]|uniref:Glutamate dehydrogenase n=1 Tax=Zobellia galactanivorans (strain DSM 12802 / CCUG 47099 / CIP 106680 / NCIMB 13871 / Dsij) TaxID=63186 RepID=G0L8P2_ZOBGA|nr:MULTISPECIES: Glu/Leu/Phe/Val dehydrogenase [Zobellia]MBU3024243.1 Glu/Leu/Phe/Val dehydrogenase [Zobellia galactanivorans]MDO6809686.1 Glu/Leu/Phe/Val dehydrogenase [Zobellia galactanivorans]OWW23294.1 glutamate dehydrogenase [Zobellia sp. OII3]CAZ97729.1 Glutamate dehydrogenase [Zobellia galactanivorans]
MIVKTPEQKKALKQGMLANVMRQFDNAADIIDLNPNIRKILEVTNNELVVHFPVRMDDGEVEIFTGYRVQHNNSLGPYKGGLRYHPTVDIDAARALAMWMTWKTSLAGLPYGGAKGGIQLDPTKYSNDELQRITRRFTYALGDNIGPELDIPAPDVNTNPQTMAWILDTYMSTKSPAERSTNMHVVTGKPIGAGGSQGRDRATGYGVFLNIKFWAEHKNIDLKDKRFIVQGFGNVGYWAAHFLEKEGASMIAVQDAYGSIVNEEGIPVEDLLAYTKANKGSIMGFAKAETLDNAAFFGLDCDICIPAALGNQITEANASSVKAYLIAEGANGPTDVAAEEILLKKGVAILPDILCNSGGVIGSYFEWLQNRNGEIWQLDEVLQKLEKKLRESFVKVVETSENRKIDMRTAAFIIAIERLEEAYVQRGIFP